MFGVAKVTAHLSFETIEVNIIGEFYSKKQIFMLDPSFVKLSVYIRHTFIL